MILNTLKQSVEFDYVVFDKDGTIVGGIPLWKKIFYYHTDAAKEIGFDIETTATRIFGSDEAKSYSPFVTFKNSEIPILFAISFWLDYGLPWDQCKELSEKIIELGFNKVNKKELYTPLPGSMEVLNYFHKQKVPIFIATSDSRVHTLEMLTYLGISHMIYGIVTSDEVKNGKPFPDILFKIQELIADTSKKGIMIGDNSVDFKMAKRADFKSICIGPEDLGAEGWYQSLLQLLELNIK